MRNVQDKSSLLDERRYRLLIVDDEPLILTELRDALQHSNLDIIEACDGLEALAYVDRAGAPDIVLTDIRMPRLDGLSFVSRLLGALPQGKHCAVIFVSGHGDVPDVAAALRLNAEDYIEKPMGRNQVRAAVDTARKVLVSHHAAQVRQSNLLSDMEAIRDRTDRLMTEYLEKQSVPSELAKPKIEWNSEGDRVEGLQIYLDQIEAIKRIHVEKNNILGEVADDGVMWTMLVDLFSAHLLGKNVTVTSLCCVSNVPPAPLPFRQIRSGAVYRRNTGTWPGPPPMS